MTCDSCGSNSSKNDCGVCCNCLTVTKKGDQLACNKPVIRAPNKYNYHCCSKFSVQEKGTALDCVSTYSDVTPVVKNFCVNKTNPCKTIIEEGNGTCCNECEKKTCNA